MSSEERRRDVLLAPEMASGRSAGEQALPCAENGALGRRRSEEAESGDASWSIDCIPVDRFDRLGQRKVRRYRGYTSSLSIDIGAGFFGRQQLGIFLWDILP